MRAQLSSWPRHMTRSPWRNSEQPVSLPTLRSHSIGISVHALENFPRQARSRKQSQAEPPLVRT